MASGTRLALTASSNCPKAR
uniref:Uncharacterized protein n=1 Tax=Anguilla anguilla TaxID=7936 RepID=A0A0E9QKF8_ANGAN